MLAIFSIVHEMEFLFASKNSNFSCAETTSYCSCTGIEQIWYRTNLSIIEWYCTPIHQLMHS